MSLQNQIVISVTDATPVVTTQDFTTTVFLDAHRWFPERYRTFTKIEEVAALGIPITSAAYRGAQTFFTANSKGVGSALIIARRNADVVIAPNITVANGITFSFTLNVTGGTVAATYTATTGDDAEDVVTNLAADINAVGAVTSKINAVVSGTGVNAILTITPDLPTNEFEIKSLVGLGASFTATEAVVDALIAFEGQTDQWTLIASSDHSQGAVLALAAAIESRHKQYIVWVQDSNVLTFWNGTSTPTDTLGLLDFNERSKTITGWHDQADLLFPELAIAGRYMGSEVGTISWQYKDVGVPVARDPALLVPLSSTQLGYLTTRHADTIIKFGGVSTNGNFTTATGKKIELVRGGEFLATKYREAIELLFLTKDKIPYDDTGITTVKSTHANVWTRYISSAARPSLLDPVKPYKLTYPKAADVTYDDKSNGILRASAIAYFAGEIGSVVLNIQTSYNITALGA